MPSKNKIGFYLALLSMALGFSYFLCGRVSGKRASHKLEEIGTGVVKNKEIGEKIDSNIRELNRINNFNSAEIVRELQSNRKKIEEASELSQKNSVEKGGSGGEIVHLKKWRDSLGNETIGPRAYPEIDSFLKHAVENRVVDLNKD
ncbi:MAG: hypothetical protein J5I94_13990 [Phaeodactylibacter sp.]|nr:hypothetical protein [Phaeodactylibacter sp.]